MLAFFGGWQSHQDQRRARMKPSAAVIALPVFAFSANTGAQKPFTWNSPVLTRFFAQLRPLSAGVDFHGVDD